MNLAMWESWDDCLDASETLESCSDRHSLSELDKFEPVLGKKSSLRGLASDQRLGSYIGRTVPDHVCKRAAGWHVLVAIVVKGAYAMATSQTSLQPLLTMKGIGLVLLLIVIPHVILHPKQE